MIFVSYILEYLEKSLFDNKRVWNDHGIGQRSLGINTELTKTFPG